MPGSLKEIKGAGFDGVECHLIGQLRFPKEINEVRAMAEQLGLGIRFHQGWSWATGQRNLHNHGLFLLNQLVPIGMPLEEQLCYTNDDPVVVYGNHIHEFPPPHYLYQTASEHIHGKEFPIPFDEFLIKVHRFGIPICFDTQHVLEWFLDKHTVAGLPSAVFRILRYIESLWDELNPYVKEIHLCDFDPIRGRNLQLGDGIFPLGVFSRLVKSTCWSGVICPEVHPRHITSLPALRARVAGLFE